MVRRAVGGTLALALLAGCASERTAPPPTPLPEAPPPKPSGGVKIGQPYQINGVWYYPKDDPTYDQTGIASWYGHPFHGSPTANGETYDMDDLTAAHQTLPLPSFVRVTNLDNGRSIVLKVNDRGPFVNGRIIDVSRRAARLLGFYDVGTAKVRVQVVNTAQSGAFIAEKPVTPPDEAKVTAAPLGRVAGTTLAPPPEARQAPPKPVERLPKPTSSGPPLAVTGKTDPEHPEVTVLPVPTSTAIYIQVGAFTNLDNAKRLRDQLTGFGPARVAKTEIKGQTFHRVRIGPIATVDQADELLARVLPQNPAARIVVD